MSRNTDPAASRQASSCAQIIGWPSFMAFSSGFDGIDLRAMPVPGPMRMVPLIHNQSA
jgi:hypothetical protein